MTYRKYNHFFYEFDKNMQDLNWNSVQTFTYQYIFFLLIYSIFLCDFHWIYKLIVILLLALSKHKLWMTQGLKLIFFDSDQTEWQTCNHSQYNYRSLAAILTMRTCYMFLYNALCWNLIWGCYSSRLNQLKSGLQSHSCVQWTVGPVINIVISTWSSLV